MPSEIERSTVPKRHASSLSDALDGVIRDRAAAVRDIEVFDKIIANLRLAKAELEGAAPAQLPEVTPGQYAGMRTGEALGSYLKQRAGHKIPVDKVCEDLVLGGAVLAEKLERQLHNLKITVRRSPKLVQVDEHWNIWLAETATQKPKPRNAKKS